MNLVNLTNRTINILDSQDEVRLSIKPSGLVVAGSMTVVPKETFLVDGTDEEVIVVGYRYGAVSELPEPKPDTYYIVSYAVLQALGAGREDVLAPDTSPGSVVRQEGTQKVLGVKQLRRL